MTAERHVPTEAIRDAVNGRETEVLKALGIGWKDGASHSHCPYPGHDDANPSWRWDQAKARAFCSCIDGSHTILDVLARCAGVEFQVAKLLVAQILGRQDLIKEKGSRRHQGMDAASLLRPTAEERDDELVPAYLAYRLGVEPSDVPLPSTPVVGWGRLPYYDPPARKGEKATLIGRYPCVIFSTAAPDGRKHALRIYLNAGGEGKAELGVAPDGQRRDAKKSAKLAHGASSAGCAVLWGDAATAPHLIVAEGPETAAALAFVHRAELEAGTVALAAALSTGGIRALEPWAANRRITIAADRDEGKPPTDRAFKAGERAAHAFARKHHAQREVRIALPGAAGRDIDWLDILRTEGVEAVRSGVASAEPFVPPQEPAEPDAEPGSPDPEQIERDLSELVERAKADPGAPFEREAVVVLASARHATPAAYQRAIRGLKQAGARMRDLDREIRRANLRVIEGGGAGSGFEARLADINAYGLQTEPSTDVRDGDIGTLRLNGANAEETSFLRRARVELNAFTSDQLVGWLEGKLEDHGIAKVVPDDAALELAYRRTIAATYFEDHARDLIEAARKHAAAADLPSDLRRRMEAALEADPARSWATVLRDLRP